MATQRREFLKALGAGVLATSALGSCANATRGAPKVVVVGGGYGGATVAKYLHMWSNGAVDVTVVEANPAFVSCPLSNLVLGGSKQLADLTVSYDGLRKRGVKVVSGTATAIDVERGQVRLASGQDLPFDRVVLSPGVDFMYGLVPGLNNAAAQERVLHAWKAGPQTVALRRQLEAMPDGGVYALSIPRAPYRCPPGPYERACQVAWYFKRAKPRSKVLILDGNEDVVSKKGLFTKAWNEDYKDIVEYRPNHVLTDVDVATLTARFETADDVKANVLNVIPPHGAGAIARKAGVITANDRWCEVDFLSFESIKVPKIHVLGDSIQVAPLMPKSGHMANQHAKVAAAAILNAFAGVAPNPAPVLNNTCYSFITDKDVVHVASVHQYDRDKKTLLTVPGSGGLSPGPSAVEGEFAFAWARNIWADALA
ncbi:MAG TPA: NAD(P)/FAD-dependent oxidoreductase [Casimicrobiaceae bacterium]|nr:NAD(P)/FAD-dependent oxidoreductase [Casimicrobiaceae bacterium]